MRWPILAAALLCASGLGALSAARAQGRVEGGAKGARDIPLAQAWKELGHNDVLTFWTSASDPKPYVDPRTPDAKAVEAYFKLTLVKPRLGGPQGDYDQVLSHDIFYCGTDRYALVESVFYLGAKPIATIDRPSKLVGRVKTYEPVTISAKSLMQTAYYAACDIEAPDGHDEP